MKSVFYYPSTVLLSSTDHSFSMATVNLDNVQFWQPPLNSNRATKSKDYTRPTMNRYSQSNSPIESSRGYQPKVDGIGNRGKKDFENLRKSLTNVL